MSSSIVSGCRLVFGFIPFSVFSEPKTQSLNAKRSRLCLSCEHNNPVTAPYLSRNRTQFESLIGENWDAADGHDFFKFMEEDNDENCRVKEKILKAVSGLESQAVGEYMKIYNNGRLSVNDCNGVLAMLGDEDLFEQALSMFEWMRLQKPCFTNSATYCLIFTMLGKVGMHEKLWDLFQNMPQAEEYQHAHVFNALVLGFMLNHRYDDAFKVFKEMGTRGITPNSISSSCFEVVIGNSCQNAREVWDLFVRMFKSKMKQNSKFFSAIIKTFCHECLTKEALIISSDMEKHGFVPDVTIYNLLIDAYGKAGQLEEAEGLFLEMKQRCLQPSTLTYNLLINAYSDNGLCDIVEQLVDELEQSGLLPDVSTYTSLINAYARKQSESDKVADIFQRMTIQGLHPTSEFYTALIRAYSVAGCTSKAHCTLGNMLKEGLTPSVETFTVLLDHYKQVSDTEKLRELWELMMEVGLEGTREVYDILVDGFSRRGSFCEVEYVIRKFKKMDLKPTIKTYNMLIKAYAVGGRHNLCSQVMKEMKFSGIEPDPYTYSTLIYAFFKNRDYRKAYYYYGEMIKHFQVTDTKLHAKMKAVLELKNTIKITSHRKVLVKKLRKMDNLGKNRQSKEFWKHRKRTSAKS